MKKYLWGLGAVVVVLIGAVLIAPSFIDWNQYKGEIAHQAKKYTGRDLAIGGDIRAAVLPAPALIVEDVSLGNIEGASSPEMATLRRLEVRIAFAPLLVGRLQVETVRLIGPVIELERTADGRTNWSFDPPADTGAPAAGGTGGGADASAVPDVALQNFRIVDGALIYRDVAAGTVQRIDDIDAEVAAATLQGPFETSGALSYGDLRIGFQANVGEIIQDRTVPLGMRLDIGDGAAVADVSGTVLGLEEKTPRLKADIKLAGPDAARLARRLAGSAAADLPDFLAQSFALETALTASVEEVSAGNLLLSLGELRTRGAIRAQLGDLPEVRIDLAAESVDLDKLLAIEAPSPEPDTAADRAGEPAGTGDGADRQPVTAGGNGGAGLAIPTGVAGSVSLRIDALRLQGEVVRNAVLNAELAQGEVTLSQLSAQLPGATDVAVFGFLTAKDGRPQFEGDVEAKAGDLRAVLGWAGVQLTAIPSDRLHQLTLAAEVRSNPAQTAIEKLRLQFDNTTVTGGAVIAHRARPSFGVGLTVDRIDLDAYMAPAPAGERGSGTGAGAAPADTAAAAPTPRNDGPATPFAGLSALTRFDANVRLHVKRFVYDGRRGDDLFAEAVAHANALDIKRLSVGGYAGVSGQLSGRLTDLAAMPKAEALELEVGGKDLGPLFDAVGVEPPLPAATLGASRLRARIDGSLLNPDVDATLETLGGRATVAGRVNVLPVAQRFDLTLGLRHADPAALLDAVSGGAYRPAGPLGVLDLTAAVSGNAENLNIAGVQGRLGELALKGSGAVDFTGPRPRLVADLGTGEIVVDAFLPRERQASRGGGRLIPAVAPRTGGAGVVPAAAETGGRWSDAPIDLSGLGALDATVKLTAEALRFRRYDLENADIAAALAAGTLTVERLTGQIFDGDLRADATLAADGANEISGAVSLQNAQVERLLQAVRGKAGATGRLSASGNFRTSLASVRRAVTSLGGDGSLTMTDVDVDKGITGSTLTGLFGMVTAMNQLGGVLGGGSRFGQGLADAAATFRAENGVIAVSEAVVESNFGQATAAGAVDLPAWRIDFEGRIRLAPNAIAQLFGKSLEKEPVPFAITGSLDAPTYNVDTSKLAAGSLPIPGADRLLQKVPEGAKGLIEGLLGGRAAPQPGPESAPAPQAGSESGAPAPPPQQAPPQQRQQPVSPRDLIRGLLNR